MTRNTGEIHTKVFGYNENSPEAQQMQPRVLAYGIDITHATYSMMKHLIADENFDSHGELFLKFITEGCRELGDQEEVTAPGLPK